MLKPHEMTRAIITGPKSLQGNIIDTLHALKILHIVEHSKNDLADIGEPLSDAPKYSEVLVKIRAIISALGIEKGNGILVKKLQEAQSCASRAGAEISELNEEIKQIDDARLKNEAAKAELEILRNIKIPLENISGYKSIASFIGFVGSEKHLEEIKNSLPKSVKNYLVLESILAGKLLIVVFADENSKDKVLEILSKNGFLAYTFSNIAGLRGTAEKNLQRIYEENARLSRKKTEISKRTEKIKNEYKDLLLGAQDFLSSELEKAEAPLRFASTPSSFLIKGWIPKTELAMATERLERAGKKKIYMHFEEPKKTDKVPVKLRNPRLVAPFEFFIDLYSYPTYKEIDPTFFVFLTFPIFFGAMLGDLGYGIVALLLFLLLRWKMPQFRGFMNIMILASLSSIIFGLIYGEAFGYVFLHHPIIHRSAENTMFMPLAIAVGAVHLNLGLIIGFFNELKSHGFMHAAYAKLSWILLQTGAALLALSLFGILKLHWGVGAFVILAAIVMLLKGEGVRGVIELPSIFSNMLSYARLMAIGLSSVILAEIINESSAEMIHHGGIMLVLGIFIMIVGHTINLLLGLFGSFLHSLRLHYVEFFSKFFQGGAKKYLPFGLKE